MNHQSLIAAGFEQVASDTQEGVIFRKRTRAEDLSYVNEHIVDGEFVTGSMWAVTEVAADGSVSLSIAEADYLEGPHPGGTTEANDLLRDAGVAA